MRKSIQYLSVFILFVIISGCGVSTRTLNDGEQRLQDLKKRGVPDSLLSRATVFLYQARDAKDRGNRGLSRSSADSMKILIEKAEAWYSENMKTVKPALDSLRAVITAEGDSLTGLQRAALDSITAVIDSFVAMDWLIQAHAVAEEAAAALPGLLEDEKKAAELKKKLPGKWQCTVDITSDAFKAVKAVERKIFNFYRNGKVKLIENKRGRSAPNLRENWEFISYGTYDLKGDTIHLFVDRFKAVRQIFNERIMENNRQVWKKTVQPPYDSTITDGSQDRHITWADLKLDFKKRARY